MSKRVHKPARKSARARPRRGRRADGAGLAASAPDADVAGISNTELDALYASFLQQPAQLTTEQMNGLERRLCTVDAEWRKLAFASLTKSGAELKERFAASREAAQLAAELLTVADHMGKRLHEIAGMLETASTRLMLSLCERPDMQELIAAARAQLERGTLPPAAEKR
jgi:hypothetical protein